MKLQIDITTENIGDAVYALDNIMDNLANGRPQTNVGHTVYVEEDAVGLFELLDSQPAAE